MLIGVSRPLLLVIPFAACATSTQAPWGTCPVAHNGAPETLVEAPAQLPAVRACAAKVFTDLDYFGDGLERHRLDLYLPRGKGPFPVVLQLHGGGYAQGSKGNNPLRIAWLLEAGMAVASVNYRLLPPKDGQAGGDHAYLPAPLVDAKAAVRWLRAHAETYDLDARHVGVWGGSAGGHLAAMLGTTAGVAGLDDQGPNRDQSSAVQAVVVWYGLTDLRAVRDQVGEDLDPFHRFLGVPEAQADARTADSQLNVLAHVTQDDAPMLAMFGDRDNPLLYLQTVAYVRALEDVGVASDYVVIKHGGHGQGPFFKTENVRTVQAFFQHHLRPR